MSYKINNKKIDSPLSTFNNIILEISDTLNEVIYGDTKINQLTLKSELVFEENSITIKMLYKLILHKHKMYIKVLRPISQYEFELLNKIHLNFGKVSTTFYRYIQMYNLIANGYDDVPASLIQNLIDKIKNSIQDDTGYLIPFKNKIDKKLNSDNGFMSNIFNKYQYIIKFDFVSQKTFTYTIYQVLSSDLDESKSLENLRYLDKDTIKTNTIPKADAEKFIIDLFNYGKL